MKIISGMLGVLMLTALALPLEAKEVYVKVIDKTTFSSAQDLDSLDDFIRTPHYHMSHWFKPITNTEDGNLKLGIDKALVLRGGRGSIGADLDQYKSRSISGATYLRAYGCYKKRPFPRENTTYVIVSSWTSGPGMPYQWCDQRTLISGGIINVGQLSTKVKAMPKD